MEESTSIPNNTKNTTKGQIKKQTFFKKNQADLCNPKLVGPEAQFAAAQWQEKREAMQAVDHFLQGQFNIFCVGGGREL